MAVLTASLATQSPRPADASSAPLDPGFAPGGFAVGVVREPATASAGAVRVLPMSDGRFVVLGTALTSPGFPGGTIHRHRADGTLDPTFAPAGPHPGWVDEPSMAAPVDGIVFPDGSLVIADHVFTTQIGGGGGLWRFAADGTPDASFARPLCTPPCFPAPLPDGFINLHGHAARLLLADATHFYAVVETNDDYVQVVRYRVDGSVDSNWPSSGGAGGSLNVFAAQSVVGAWMGADGSVTVAGYSYQGGRLFLTRLHADGTTDAAFGAGGTLEAELPPIAVDQLFDVRPDPSGRLLATGFERLDREIYAFLTRIDASGRLDHTFAAGSPVPGMLGRGRLLARPVGFDKAGRILAVGSTDDGHAAAQRITDDGVLDATFDAGGVTPGTSSVAVPPDPAIGSGSARFLDGFVDGIGRLVAVGEVGGPRAPTISSLFVFPIIARLRTDADDGPGVASLHLLDNPVRLADTRVDSVTGRPLASKMPGGQVIAFRLEAAHVPNDAGLIVLTATVTEPDGPGFLTVWPCDEPRPTASNLNYEPGQTVPNVVTVRPAADGTVCVYSQVRTHLVLDVTGYVEAGHGVHPRAAPVRVLDTRHSTGGEPAKPGPGDTVVLRLPDAPPPGVATAALLNVTATEGTAAGFVTVWPCNEPRPTASSLNVDRGGTVANLVITAMAPDGTVCLFTQSGTHLVADLAGVVVARRSLNAVTPKRVLETRAAEGQRGYSGGKPAAGAVISITVQPIEGAHGSALLNVTGVDAEAAGFVTIWPCDRARPATSNLNLVPGRAAASAVITRLDAQGRACVFTQASAHLVVDVTGVG